jgi:hypothetical protein
MAGMNGSGGSHALRHERRLNGGSSKDIKLTSPDALGCRQAGLSV